MATASSKSKRSSRRAYAAKPVVAERRVRLDLDERRAQLLELGINLFSKRSYDDISIDEVAEIAGISKGLLYHYFSSKRDFYVETLRAASRRLQLLTIPDPALPPAAQLRAAIDAHLRYIQEHGSVYNAVYRSGVSMAPEVREIVEEHREVVMHYFLRTLGTSKPRPLLRTAIRAWIAMVEGASLDWIANPAVPRDELRELLVVAYAAVLAKTMELDPKAASSLK